jgi:hypothetical protein
VITKSQDIEASQHLLKNKGNPQLEKEVRCGIILKSLNSYRNWRETYSTYQLGRLGSAKSETITSQTMSAGDVLTSMIASILGALSGNDANRFTISLVPVPLG